MEEEPEEQSRPSAFQVLVRVYRALRGWDRTEYAAKAGLDPKTVYRAEAAGVIPQMKTQRKMADAAGLSLSFVEVCLKPALEAARAASAPFDDETFGDVKKAGAELDRALSGTGRSAVGLLLQEIAEADRQPWERNDAPSEADRREATDAWERLETCDDQGRRLLVETCPEFQTWALAERLCHESEAAAADTAKGALELATLACKVAELAPCEEPRKSRLRGYTLAFLANARRAGNDLRGANEDFARALKLWQQGAAAEPGLLAERRLFDLEGFPEPGRPPVR